MRSYAVTPGSPGSDLIDWLTIGNPLLHLTDLTRGAVSGGQLADTLPDLLRGYAMFHGVLALGCLVWASTRLRVVFRKQVYGQVQRATRGGGGSLVHVGRWPMNWKETRRGARLRLSWFGRLLVAVIVASTFLPVLLGPSGPGQGAFLGVWARIAGALVACLLLLQVAVQASTALSEERDRQTLDGLLATPLTAGAILFGKWFGCWTSVRWGWLWLGAIWGMGVAARGLQVLELPLLLAAWGVYAATMATVGLWYSLVSRSSMHATVLTVLTAVGLGISYLLSLMAVPFATQWLGETDSFLIWLNRCQQGVSPLASLAWLLPYRETLIRGTGKEAWELPSALLGLLAWAVAGVVLWVLLYRRFCARSGRETVRRPEGLPAAVELAARADPVTTP
jgi:hypothetical protein